MANINHFCRHASFCLSLLCCSLSLPAKMPEPELYQEQYRPQLHFSPARQWMNDPNGLVYLDGEYHLFYQYHPYSNVWGPMHWGHAVSRDLLHWQELAPALYPDQLGTIFSGSIVIDHHNSSGLGQPGIAPMVAIFTYHDQMAANSGSQTFQSQGLAYSLDRGRSWQKYQANPVLANPGKLDFRDPKISWHAASKRWIMTLAVKNQLSFYSSSNLLQWQHLSDFGAELQLGGVWECPDLVPMTIAGSNKRKDVLLASINPGAPNGGSGTFYLVGQFDGQQFLPDRQPNGELQLQWLDYGTDNYAGVTFTNLPTARPDPLLIGWMSNWNYATTVPTERWRSSMTLPRQLQLQQIGDSLLLTSTPLAELQSHQQLVKDWPGHTLTAGASWQQQWPLQPGDSSRLQLELQPAIAGKFRLQLGNGKQQLQLRFDLAKRQLILDRSAAGEVSFSNTFAALQQAPLFLPATPTSLKLDLILDQNSLELFINDGSTVLTSLLFPSTAFTQLSLQTEQALRINSGRLYRLPSVWPKAATSATPLQQ